LVCSIISTDRLPSGVQGLKYGANSQGLSLPGDPTQNDYILFVHGWNVPPWEKDAYAETALKRLYWQGYKGKFGTFEWPTTYTTLTNDFFSNLQKVAIYDDGEFSAWQSATPLEQLLVGLHNTYGTVDVLAHSMGNVVAGEALRIAGQSGAGQLVNTYVATQAAVPGHCYDPTLPDALYDYYITSIDLSGGLSPVSLNTTTTTPNIYDNWLVPPNQSVGTHGNFYNVNDYALYYWRLDQALKPDSGYSYLGTNFQPVDDFAYMSGLGAITSLHLGTAGQVQDRYEIMAYASQPWSNALGAVPNVAGFAPQKLPSLWLPDPFETDPSKLYSDHPWHSAQFRFTNADQANYWHALLGQNGFDLLP
jgi:hypothetical protein